MYFTGVYSLADARKEKLVQLTVWLFKNDLDWLEQERKRIGGNETRKVMIVQNGSAYALYVNDVTGRWDVDNENTNHGRC